MVGLVVLPFELRVQLGATRLHSGNGKVPLLWLGKGGGRLAQSYGIWSGGAIFLLGFLLGGSGHDPFSSPTRNLRALLHCCDLNSKLTAVQTLNPEAV